MRGLALTQYPYLIPTPTLEEQTTEKIARAARGFYQAIAEKKQCPPSLTRVLQFRVLKCNTLVAGDYWQADRAFYENKPSYYYETPIAPHKKLVTWLFERFFWSYMRKNYLPAQER